jgi:hypothetical protein
MQAHHRLKNKLRQMPGRLGAHLPPAEIGGT